LGSGCGIEAAIRSPSSSYECLIRRFDSLQLAKYLFPLLIRCEQVGILRICDSEQRGGGGGGESIGVGLSLLLPLVMMERLFEAGSGTHTTETEHVLTRRSTDETHQRTRERERERERERNKERTGGQRAGATALQQASGFCSGRSGAARKAERGPVQGPRRKTTGVGGVGWRERGLICVCVVFYLSCVSRVSLLFFLEFLASFFWRFFLFLFVCWFASSFSEVFFSLRPVAL
jgi:hypothetical protein